MADWRTRSLWLSRRPYEPAPPLDGGLDVDVVIVGGGFTGLWTAIHLKDADPSVDVAVLEQRVAGYGASGRNGGFAMTMIGRNLHDLVRKAGPARARATRLAMRSTLRDIAAFVRDEGIDADLTRPGLLTVSNGPEQDERIRQDLEASQRLGLDDLRYLSGPECRSLVATDRIRCGHFEEDALLVDPAALTRGLRDAAVRRGVRVFESTPVRGLALPGTHVVARTPGGDVRADRALLATNAYAHAVPALRRWLFTIVASIVVTEPLTGEQWKRVGWDGGAGVEDKRIMPHFHRPTPDGRILWGGRDAPFAPAGPDPRQDRSPRVFRRLEETFRWTFPQLDDVRIDRGWCGPVAGTVNCFAHAGRLGRGRRVVYALGYAGHGVGPSHLTAKIARDLLLDRGSELLDLPMAAKRPVPLPPGPLRGLVLNGSQRVLQRADDGDGGPLTGLALRFLQ
ncbi:NAD(P)/FAD-dependent oxidoreductase [Actinomadura montaniterrae]|uniref:FAD-dependent oxidoreductase n=1 Tax=Actinomadura montaniterrae TaxID=1803903 RepID=A0A6L3VW14_9ACTN|nr:FAD-binding oxidoreductase [Actinomadura montaniterrae]KAB2380488.1 FAD-dependent oxidoreductase [Actinomadura montaniterrae]